MKILFLGYGHMGSALGEAWRASALAPEVLAVDPHATGRPHCYASLDALREAGRAEDIDLIVLAVKPALASAAVAGLPPAWAQRATLLSVAAGVTVQTLADAAPPELPIVRAMPNTPALLGAGCSGVFAGPGASDLACERLDALLRVVGSVHWLDSEAQVDMVTAISGSGPAYYHLFSEALAQAGEALGLPAGLARALAADTAWGAATQQHQPDADFAALRRAVTSPKGTTAAAIDVFEQHAALRSLVSRAADAAHRRAIELSQPH